MASARKSVIIAGLGHHISSTLQERFSVGPNDAQRGLDTVLPAAGEAGFDYELVFLDAEDPEGAVREFRQTLQSKAWDGVTIGFGIRGVMEYTKLFENLVNAAAEEVPGIRFGFSTRPELVLETMYRMFPAMKKA